MDDQTRIIFIFIIIGVALLATFFTISLIIFNSINKKYRQRILDESNTTRIFIIDVKKNIVTYFNRSDIRNKKVMDLAGFYQKFHQNDVEKLKKWIFTICLDVKSATQYLEADVLVNRGKSSYFSLLKLLKYDPNIGLIHLESILLKYMTPINSTIKKRRGVNTGVVKRSIISQMVSREKSIRGYTYAIRFFYVQKKILSNDKIERYMVMTLKNEVYPYANDIKSPRQIVDTVDNELLLFDLRINNREDAMHLATSIEHSLKKCIGVNGYGGSVNFSIGIVENAQFYQDFETIVNKAQEACISAQQNNQTILIYQKTVGQMLELNKYSEQVDKLLRGNSIRYLFRPIVDVTKNRTLGYFQYVKAYDSPFTTFAEMSKYAAKVGKNRKLFAMVAKYVIPKFENEKQSDFWRLFFHVSMVDIDHMVEILPQIPSAEKIHLVLVFDEQEINENSSQLELLNSSMQKLRNLKYELALSMKDKNLLLDPSVYYNFDYFVAGAAMIGEIRKNNRIRLSIHTLIEQLLKYNRPIIATDLEGWQAIELIIKSGVTVVSSETISPSNDMLLPVEKKKMEKLIAMDDNFR